MRNGVVPIAAPLALIGRAAALGVNVPDPGSYRALTVRYCPLLRELPLALVDRSTYPKGP
jgi:hypothetical protein